MTEKIYLHDAYAKDFEAKVTKVEGASVVLDKTAFYPTGGGQPGDTGFLEINGNRFNVIDVRKAGEEVIHVLDKTQGIEVGAETKGHIDWEKRYAHMRLHTAIHLLDGIIEKYFNAGMLTGGQIYDDRARIDIDMQDLTREKAEEIIKKANEISAEGHEIIVKEISRDEALSIPRLSRTAPGRELISKLDVVRVVEIVGVDEQADGGTHVRNTKEIGRIVLGKYENKGKHNKRVEITLENAS